MIYCCLLTFSFVMFFVSSWQGFQFASQKLPLIFRNSKLIRFYCFAGETSCGLLWNIVEAVQCRMYIMVCLLLISVCVAVKLKMLFLPYVTFTKLDLFVKRLNVFISLLLATGPLDEKLIAYVCRETLQVCWFNTFL